MVGVRKGAKKGESGGKRLKVIEKMLLSQLLSL